jgi:hypothetical protein
VAGGIAGALSGAGSLPKEWIEQVDYATTLNSFTNNKRTLRQHADGLYDAYINRFEKMRGLSVMMEI